MAKPITPETQAAIHTALVDERFLATQFLSTVSAIAASALPSFALVFDGIFNFVNLQLFIYKNLPGKEAAIMCDQLHNFYKISSGLTGKLVDICEKLNKHKVLSKSLALVKHIQIKQGTHIHFASHCLNLISTAQKLNGTDSLVYSTSDEDVSLKASINGVVDLLKPLAGTLLPNFPEEPHKNSWQWLSEAVDRLIKLTQNNSAGFKNANREYCFDPYKNSDSLRVITFLGLQAIFAFTCSKLINTWLANRLLTFPDLDVNTLIDEEQGQNILRELRENKVQLEQRAKKIENFMYWLCYTLPLLVTLLFFAPRALQPIIFNFIIISLGFTAQMVSSQVGAYRQKNRWELQRTQLTQQLEIALQGLQVRITSHYADNSEACYFLLVVEKNNTLKLKKDEQRQVLMRVLHQYKIDTTPMGGSYRFAISGQTILANATDINKSLIAEIKRREQLVILEKQLTLLADNITLEIEPKNDASGLPIFRCSILAGEYNETIKGLFAQNQPFEENNFLIMQGFTPANKQTFNGWQKTLPLLPSTNVAPLQRLAADDVAPALPPAQPRQRRRQHTKAEPVPQAAPERVVNIVWPSGKQFNSAIAQQADYARQRDSIFEITSPFLPRYRCFFIFDIHENEIDNPVIYNRFRALAQQPQMVARVNEQGLVLCDEERNFNKFIYSDDGILTGRRRIDYHAAMKMKIFGAHGAGDSRVFCMAERDPVTGATLLHGIEYDPETH